MTELLWGGDFMGTEESGEPGAGLTALTGWLSADAPGRAVGASVHLPSDDRFASSGHFTCSATVSHGRANSGQVLLPTLAVCFMLRQCALIASCTLLLLPLPHSHPTPELLVRPPLQEHVAPSPWHKSGAGVSCPVRAVLNSGTAHLLPRGLPLQGDTPTCVKFPCPEVI